MAFRHAVFAAVLLAFLAGCSKSGSEDMKERMEDIKDNVKESADHVWSAQVKALDKAKGVEQTLMDAAKEQRQAMDKDSE
jgi:outer membrane lipoprotein-sorting protein